MTKAASCLVVVPMKDPQLSKSRLRDALTPTARQALAKQLFLRTLDVLFLAQKSIDFDIAVVTGSVQVAKLVHNENLAVIDEGEGQTLNSAIANASAWSASQGYTSMCVIPADLAAPNASDIVAFVKTGVKGHDVVICPSTDLGTNALFVALPTALKFSYGPKSAQAHLMNATQSGLDAVLMPLASLNFDIDTTACLTEAMKMKPGISRLMEASKW